MKPTYSSIYSAYPTPLAYSKEILGVHHFNPGAEVLQMLISDRIYANNPFPFFIHFLAGGFHIITFHPTTT